MVFLIFQGPCIGNQQSLAHSRLWDAVVGFLHVFANMQMKLSQVFSTLIVTVRSPSLKPNLTFTAQLYLSNNECGSLVPSPCCQNWKIFQSRSTIKSMRKIQTGGECDIWSTYPVNESKTLSMGHRQGSFQCTEHSEVPLQCQDSVISA